MNEEPNTMQIFDNINQIFVKSINLSNKNHTNNKENIEHDLIRLYHLD